MPYNEDLARRVRAELGSKVELQEKKMFGGVGFLIGGNLACGVTGNNLIVRVGAENHSVALAKAHTRPFAMGGRPMTGWIEVEPDGCRSEEALKLWIKSGVAFARSLPPK